MDNSNQTDVFKKIDSCIEAILSLIGQDRERDIITRRYGLNCKKETLEQVGESLHITRERVRQIENAILTKIRNAISSKKTNCTSEVEKDIIRGLSELGRVSRVGSLANKLNGTKATKEQRLKLVFIAKLSDNLVIVDQNSYYYHSIGIEEYGDKKAIKTNVDKVVAAVRKHGKPLTIEELHGLLDFEQPLFIQALISVSKLLACRDGKWGLITWPTVNPRNIRDKIYLILRHNKKPMHFSEIAKSIQDSSFKRNDVTSQAIHNELIKDKRFVLIGRGIYALDSWGYSRGTVAEVIERILKQSDIPLHRDEIIRRVLEKRQVKEATIMLNLQSKPQFKRVSKATYTYQEQS